MVDYEIKIAHGTEKQLADTWDQETLRKFASSYIDMQGAEAPKTVRIRDERLRTPVAVKVVGDELPLIGWVRGWDRASLHLQGEDGQTIYIAKSQIIAMQRPPAGRIARMAASPKAPQPIDLQVKLTPLPTPEEAAFAQRCMKFFEDHPWESEYVEQWEEVDGEKHLSEQFLY